MKERLKDISKAVIPGFYGAKLDGEIVTFSRGGSDITGAIVANTLGSKFYENRTDVSGFLMADPRIVNSPRPIETVTYKELRELSYMGAPVLHEESLFPVKNKGIIINIRNTNFPEHLGTKIVDDFYPLSNVETITGIAGKKDFTVISIEKTRMMFEKDFLRKLITVLETNDISIEHMPSSIDSISIIVSTSQLNSKLDKVIEEIKIYCNPDSIISYPNMALIAVDGIPILKHLKEELILNKIFKVLGILNGTCNYILTKMFNEGLDYKEVLKQAQELGYAEMDPTADVEGHDTLRKIRILGTLSLQGKIEEKDIILEGIERITLFDVIQIKRMESTVKLIKRCYLQKKILL